jgi:signal transduction protein with GAF and PtsI domain
MMKTLTHQDDLTYKLLGLSSFIEEQDNLDENLHDIAVIAANILNMQNCSIMLLKDTEESEDLELRIFAHSGYLPDIAHREAIKIKEGISGHVAATGEALFIEDIDSSPFAKLKRGRYRNNGFISAPVIIHGKVIGVINANTPHDNDTITRRDLELLKIIALLISKSIQVVHLQNLLKSNYAQFAVARGLDLHESGPVNSIDYDPGNAAKVLAKTFYQEMSRAGFAPDHMITTATEILSLLSEKLDKHKDRRERN